MTVSRISVQRTNLALVIFLLVVVTVLTPVSATDAESGTATAAGQFDIYFMMGDAAAWMGSSISYTVYEPTVVEARLLSGSGEIILIYRQGLQAPGQYTLPWDGTYEGSPFAGIYTFELYFGDEYAAKFPMAVIPWPKPL